MIVSFGDEFAKQFKNFPKSDQRKIYDFAMHVRQHGFNGLQGRNKPSDNVDTNDKNFVVNVRYAIEHKLHHYHIGIPTYTQSPTGDFTSEYILHYVRVNNDEIRIVDMDSHPPFKMPSEKYLI
jgi:hypothetical protein